MRKARTQLTPTSMAARLLGIPRMTMIRWCRTGRIKACRMGIEWMVTQEGMDEAAAIEKARKMTITKTSSGGFRRFVGLAEFARMAGIPYSTAYSMVRAGKIKHEALSQKCGKAACIMVPKEEVRRLLDEQLKA